MAMTDPLGDLLTRIRNGQQARKDSVLTPASKLRTRVLDVLQREGYIRGYAEEQLAGQKGLRIELKYFGASPRSSIWRACPSPAAGSIRPRASFRASATASARSSCRPRAACCRTPRRASTMSAAKCWRRCSNVPYRQETGGGPKRRHGDGRKRHARGQGAEGYLDHADARRRDLFD